MGIGRKKRRHSFLQLAQRPLTVAGVTVSLVPFKGRLIVQIEHPHDAPVSQPPAQVALTPPVNRPDNPQ